MNKSIYLWGENPEEIKEQWAIVRKDGAFDLLKPLEHRFNWRALSFMWRIKVRKAKNPLLNMTYAERLKND